MEVLVTRAREHEAKTEAYEYAKEMAILAKLREAEELVVKLSKVNLTLNPLQLTTIKYCHHWSVSIILVLSSENLHSSR